MRDDGLVRSLRPVRGYFLTVDLCPLSKKGFNQELFETLEHASQVHGTAALPVALSVSGGWIKRHREAFAWLRNESAGVKLMLEWVASKEKDSIYFLPLESIAGTSSDR